MVKAYLKPARMTPNDAAAICEAVQRPTCALCRPKQGSAGGAHAAPNPPALGSAAHDAQQRNGGHLAELGLCRRKAAREPAELLKVIADANDDVFVGGSGLLQRAGAAIQHDRDGDRQIDKRIHVGIARAKRAGV